MDFLHSVDSTALKLVDRRSELNDLKSPIQPPSDSQSGCTDHILIWQWNELSGWGHPEIRPYGPLPIMPSASVLQYATGCFEGIKVYRGYDDKLRLFRISLNCERMVKSSMRVKLPEFAPADLEAIISRFAAIEAEKWLPPGLKGKTLYLRPTHIGTTASLGLQKPRHSLLYVVATLLPGFSTKHSGMRLLTSPANTIRAWPGGFGNAKLGANYGPTLVAHDEAIRSDFDQILWLSGPEGYVTEAGASNFFVIWISPDGELQIVTAGLHNGIILEGITRRSILELVWYKRLQEEAWLVGNRQLKPLTAVERDISIQEIQAAVSEGRLLEAFASGTAVSKISEILPLTND